MTTRFLPLGGTLLAGVLAAGCHDGGGGGPARALAPEAGAGAGCAETGASAGYHASVNGLEMYYEVHGRGEPLVLLHGAFGTIENNFGALLPTLACTRQVIAVEQQAHGRTADIDRALTYEQMADDTAELLRQIGITRADIFGYSMGGATALQVAARHPELVRKLVVVATGYSNDGYEPEILPFILSMDPEDSEGWASELREDFQRVAPRPEQWPAPIVRVREMVAAYRGLRPEQLREIRAPTLIAVGDRDIVTFDHTVEMYRLLPHAELAVFPGTDHQEMIARTDWLLSMVPRFLDAAVPDGT
jgi:pimeloyl-ACP methyl ester carboxylesterase